MPFVSLLLSTASWFYLDGFAFAIYGIMKTHMKAKLGRLDHFRKNGCAISPAISGETFLLRRGTALTFLLRRGTAPTPTFLLRFPAWSLTQILPLSSLLSPASSSGAPRDSCSDVFFRWTTSSLGDDPSSSDSTSLLPPTRRPFFLRPDLSSSDARICHSSGKQSAEAIKINLGSCISVYNHAFAFPELVAIPATKRGKWGVSTKLSGYQTSIS
ncbi:hypothetical protein LXL04_038116 [Taraxacum kok-saghyz]